MGVRRRARPHGAAQPEALAKRAVSPCPEALVVWLVAAVWMVLPVRQLVADLPALPARQHVVSSRRDLPSQA